MIEKIMNSPWFTRIIALAFSILLFTYVNYENNDRYSTAIGGATVNSSEVITNLPIAVDVDKDRYYVTGLPETATIRLEGTTAILLNTITTQNFSIVTPNLNELGKGTHTIQLLTRGLPGELSYSIYPSEVTVTVEERRSEEHEVSVNFDERLLASGYEAGTPILDKKTVEVSGSSATMERVRHVGVNVEVEKGITKDISQKLPVTVTDAEGNPLDVSVEPSEVTVTIPITTHHKEVPVVLSETGTKEPDTTYEIALAEGQKETVDVVGEKEELKEIIELPVAVDVTGIKETTTQEITPELPEGISSVKPESIKVKVTVKKTNEQATSESDADSSSSAEENAKKENEEEEESSSSAESEEESSSSSSSETETERDSSSEASSSETSSSQAKENNTSAMLE
ncbi:CdaR family protein [Pisciglobus halotolerans]|uniref:YbbR domain-containing protein n=1 Tax=Pisciglobus halotolerans TaxID=745365 RepID=A0A1I3DQA5_9LACT|nr:CdaR family protein [Pisciglobus halotolerans]SFH88915.1 YbbR domain-containing protein [Pisciglobus halotolerans]